MRSPKGMKGVGVGVGVGGGKETEEERKERERKEQERIDRAIDQRTSPLGERLEN